MSISTSFRPLNEHELLAIKQANTKGKIPDTHPLVVSDTTRVSYEKMQGGFCVCVVIVEKSRTSIEFGYLVYRGASRRSYKDPRKPIRGEMLAFSAPFSTRVRWS